MVDISQVPDLETRKKNPYEYFPYFPSGYYGDEPEYKDAVERHALMFPERPRVRRNEYYEGDSNYPEKIIDEYFKPGKAKYPVLVRDKDAPIDDPRTIPSLEIRKKNRLEYFPDFTDMSDDDEFEAAADRHAAIWPMRPRVTRIRPTRERRLLFDEKIIYRGDPYPVLIAPW